MKKLALSFAALALGTGAAFAQIATFEAADTDTSGTISLAEMQAVAPGVTEETFAALDADGSGEIDATEYQAFLDAMAGAGAAPAETMPAPM